jgi:hypothetical protein
MSIRALAKRVQQLEEARRVPLSPFQIAFGSIEAWEAYVAAGVMDGVLDGREMPVVILSVRLWHKNQCWGGPRTRLWTQDSE